MGFRCSSDEILSQQFLLSHASSSEKVQEAALQ